MSRHGRERGLGQRRFNLALMRVGSVRRRLRRGRERRLKHETPGAIVPVEVAAPPVPPAVLAEQVRLVVLAMENLGRASVRASYTGTAVEVAAPDAMTAEIFRAALAQTARTRSTDRLIRITIG